MPLRMPIPRKMREQLAQDPYMSKCALADNECSGRIEWNHSFTYSGKRQNEPYFLIPLCYHHHYTVAKRIPAVNDQIRARIKHFGAEEEFRRKFPRSKLLP